MPSVNERAAYDEWHAEHPSGQGPWYELAKRILRERPKLLDAGPVLEIGCGGGDFAAWMAANGAREVVGEDFSPVAISRAQAEHDGAGVRFRTDDIEHIDHPADAFSLVVSCETIEHVREPKRALAELVRVLRPGGTLLLSAPNYLSITGAHRAYRELSGRGWDEGGQPLVSWTLYPRTAAWMRRAGLNIVSTHGDGWYVPVPRRPGGLALRPPPWAYRWMKLTALHVLLEARKPVGSGAPARA
jgi:SAM-dependent methyltransferase